MAQLTAALAAGEPRAAQNSYSLFDRQDAGGVLPLCAAMGVAYLAFSPLPGGWLTGTYRRGKPSRAGSRMTQRPEPYRDLETDRTFATPGPAARNRGAAGRGGSLAGLALGWLLADEPGRDRCRQPGAAGTGP